MNYYRYEVTVKDLNGFPHTHYEYHHDIDACRREREIAIQELGEMSTIGPIQQSELHVWKDLEGEYQSGARDEDLEADALAASPLDRIGEDLSKIADGYRENLRKAWRDQQALGKALASTPATKPEFPFAFTDDEEGDDKKEVNDHE